MEKNVSSQPISYLPKGSNELCRRCGHKLTLQDGRQFFAVDGYYLCDRCYAVKDNPQPSGWTRPVGLKLRVKGLPPSLQKEKAPEPKADDFMDSGRVQSQTVATTLRAKKMTKQADPKLVEAVSKLPTLKETPKSLKETPKVTPKKEKEQKSVIPFRPTRRHPSKEFDASVIRAALLDLETLTFKEVAKKHNRLVGTIKTWKRRYGSANAVPDSPYTYVAVSGPKRYVKCVKLARGGILRLEGQFELFEMDVETRTFVFSLVDLMDTYERKHPA